MAKDHGPSVKDDKQYEGLRKKGMSKSPRGRRSRTRLTPRARAARTDPAEAQSEQQEQRTGSGGNRAQKQAAGRKGGKKTS